MTGEASAVEPAAVKSRHPEWIRAKMPGAGAFDETNRILRRHGLATVCEEAQCPNIGDCYRHHTATFMILGNVCTRRCHFCAVTQANPKSAPPDVDEPERLARAVLELGLKHVVITSVARDDLPDQGAGHFAECVCAVKRANAHAQIEVLIPDFRGDENHLRTVLDSPISVLNHNTETVPRLYSNIRRGAHYDRTLTLLARAAAMRPGLPVKSGIMLGLGEREDEIQGVMLDLRRTGCSILTIGQYLQPSPEQARVARYVTPDEFRRWEREGMEMGFSHVESGPLVRSSYHAWEHVKQV